MQVLSENIDTKKLMMSDGFIKLFILCKPWKTPTWTQHTLKDSNMKQNFP